MKKKCFYCGVKFFPNGTERRTKDHVYPRSRLSHRLRKFSSEVNIVNCCNKCNQAKGNQLPDLKLKKMLCQRIDAYIVGLKDFRELILSESENNETDN